MRRSLAWYSVPVRFAHVPSWADFITITVGFKVFGTHSQLAGDQHARIEHNKRVESLSVGGRKNDAFGKARLSEPRCPVRLEPTPPLLSE